MDFTWTAEEQQFRSEVREWLGTNLAGRTFSPAGSPEFYVELRDWESRLREAGYGALAWPVEYGGAGADHISSAIFANEYDRARAPQRLNYTALALLGPTLMAAGSAEQKAYWLPRILSLDDVWCQGFSETGAGSDLAALRTRATRDGDDYVLDGQKIWSSNGPHADHAFCLVRTDPDAPKHKGISYLLVDLRVPGVEVRPIEQLDGAKHFAEIFFTDARVPVANRIGAENRGWYVAMETLRIERGAGRTPQRFDDEFAQVVRILEWTGTIDRPEFRLRAARVAAMIERYRTHYWTLVSSDRAETGGVLGPLSKLLQTTTNVALHELGMDALGELADLGEAALPNGLAPGFHHEYWYARASQIFAGTSQIQRDIIARRVLGLPREGSR